MPQKRRKPESIAPKPSSATSTVSGRWLLTAVCVAVVAAAACAWLTLCLLFWQGSWQLLYHPTALVSRTPASVGVSFDPLAFATTDAGEPRLNGWWVPVNADSRYARYTVLYLHGQTGNMGDAVDDIAALHALGLNILAFDYRGYGQSKVAHPSEAHWRQDGEWALNYLTATRHVAPASVLLDGRDLGANLALEVAAAHPELAGVVVDEPMVDPVSAIFSDPRARMVPARLLVRDRWNLRDAAMNVKVPALWIENARSARITWPADAVNKFSRPVDHVWLDADRPLERQAAFKRWLDELPQDSRGR